LRGRYDHLVKASTSEDFLRAQDWLVRTEELLAQIEVVLLNNASLTIFQRLRRTKGLKKIGRADLLIASIALAQQATLVTRNLRHFRQVPNLKAVNWVD